MKKKKKKWLPLLVLVLLLAVLIIAYSAVTAANRKAAEEEANSANSENAVEMIAEYDSADAVTLSYTSKNTGETLSFVKKNGKWQYSEDEHFPLNQSIAEAMAGAISSIGVERSIDEGGPELYGLDDPAYIFNISYSDGTSREYKVGDMNSFNSEYYFMTGSRIYMISGNLLSYFNYSLYDMLEADSFPSDIDTDYISSISVKTPDGDITVSDSESAAELYKYIAQLNFTDCADYYAENAADEYGIDGTAGVAVSYKRAVSVSDESGAASTTRIDAVYNIYFGSADDEGRVYYSPAGSNMVYRMSGELYSNIAGFDTSAEDSTDA